MNYYNEHDPKAAAWLRELIAQGEIPPGRIDERSIEDIVPSELRRYTQCHFFAGIAGWSQALRLACVQPRRRLWTGSCPCQPFSAAGEGLGAADERHLWPAFLWLITHCQPPVVFGEQVASAAGREWLAGVFTDLENVAYVPAGADLCAASVRAPHIRPRLYWMAYALGQGLQRQGTKRQGPGRPQPGNGRPPRGLAHRSRDGRQQGAHLLCGGQSQPPGSGETGWLGNATGDDERRPGLTSESDGWPGPPGGPGPWDRFDILPFTDGKCRRVESGTFPLAHGVPGRVGLLRGYGNGIVPPLAAQFIQAADEAYQLTLNAA